MNLTTRGERSPKELEVLIRDARRVVRCPDCEPRLRLEAGVRCPICKAIPHAIEALCRAEERLANGDLGEAHWLARLAVQDDPELLERLMLHAIAPAEGVTWQSSLPTCCMNEMAAHCDDPELILKVRARVRARQRRFREALQDLERVALAGLASNGDVRLANDIERGLDALAFVNVGADEVHLRAAIETLEWATGCGRLLSEEAVEQR